MNLISTILGKIFHPSHYQGASTPVNATDSAPSPMAPVQSVDVNKILGDMARQKSQKLNWESSIVDLLKLLDLDSGLEARKQLAKELHFQGDMSDSASMNKWLQRQVMQKLSENGGHVPDSLKH